jgi:two-component system OmpR family sensor kinase
MERHERLISPEARVPGRAASRRWLWWAAGAYAGILAVVLGGLLLLYRGARERLDEALGLRLHAAATTAAYLVDGDAVTEWAFDPKPPADLVWLGTRLEQIRRRNDLAEITLCDADGFVLYSTSGRVDRGEPNIFWDTDRDAVATAKQGATAVTHLYRSGDLYQKSAHAPVLDSRGRTAAVLTVEGNADFFDVLATLRRGTTATVAVVMVFLGVMGWLLLTIHRSLERARRDLERQERLAAMGRMTAGIAHEIRNPLGIIRGAGQHLQRVLRDHGVEDETVDFIPEEVDRLDRILTGYLDFGTGGAGAAETVDLTRLVRRTVQLVDAELCETGVTIAVDEPLPAVLAKGDPRRLQQVLLNLVLNARDAMPDGGPVTVTIRPDGDTVRVVVLDAGHGLGDTSGERLFEPFYTTRPRGSGLGLAVSRRIAREHGGDLELADRTGGRGCAATLSLPLATGDGGHEPKTEPAE